MNFLLLILFACSIFCNTSLLSSTGSVEAATREDTPPISLAQEMLPMCVICREFYNPATTERIVTLCPAENESQESHSFHQDCIDAAIWKNGECPTCRKGFTTAELRDAGIGVNAVLVRAIVAHRTSLVAWALEHGASVNTFFGDDRVQPLYIALQHNVPCNLDIVEQLLKAGADVEGVDVKDVDAKKDTPLIVAVMRNPTAIPLLVRYGANVHRTVGGLGYLLFASSRGSPEAIEALCQCGIDKNIQHSVSKNTALHIACGPDATANKHAAARVLLDYKDTDAGICNAAGTDPLASLAHGRTAPRDLVRKLLRRGAALDGGPNTFLTPLQRAVLCDNYNIAHALLKRGANKEVMTDAGLSLVGLACLVGAQNVLGLLLKNGVDCSSATVVNGSFTGFGSDELNYDARKTPYMLAKERGFDYMAEMIRAYENSEPVLPHRGAKKRIATASSSAADEVAAPEE